MTEKQIRGMNLFDDIGCTECHSGPALNGWETTSKHAAFEEFPRYQDNDFVKKYNLAKDLGRFEVTKKDRDKYYFKVPVLRNITVTAPYFHNGATPALSEAVRVMASTQIDLDLSDEEVRNIVEQLRSALRQSSLPRPSFAIPAR